MASIHICKHCGKKYRRSKNRIFGTMFCSKKCYWQGQAVTVQEIWKRDHGICWLCGHWCPIEEASRDHVRARHFGGKTTFQNIKLAHRSCNSERGHKDPKEYKALLEAKWLAKGWVPKSTKTHNREQQ